MLIARGIQIEAESYCNQHITGNTVTQTGVLPWDSQHKPETWVAVDAEKVKLADVMSGHKTLHPNYLLQGRNWLIQIYLENDP